MSEVQCRSSDQIAKQYQALAERRQRHLLDLYRSGRWRRYYSEEKLMSEMREAVRDIERWTEAGDIALGKPEFMAVS